VVGQHSCCLVKTTDLTTMHKLVVSYLRSQLQPALWTGGTKHCSQASHLVKPLQSSCLLWTGHKTKESGEKKEKNTPAVSASSCMTRGTAPFPTKSRIPSANTRIGCQRSKPRAFAEQTELLVVIILDFFGIINLSLLCSYPYYLLHVLSHSCVTIHCSPP
jgi:hypothetical protein